MSLKATIVALFEQVARERSKELAPLDDATMLLERAPIRCVLRSLSRCSKIG